MGLLLLLACVNLANVTLARAEGRAHEHSIRAALGAGAWRLIRASLIESVLLAGGGAILGLAFAYWGSDYLAHFIWRGYVPLAASLAPDFRIVLFTAGMSIVAAMFFGFIPAWRAGRNDPAGMMQGGGLRVRGGLGLAGRVFVIVQVAASFAIIAAGLLFSRSLDSILAHDPGFDSGHLLVGQLFPRVTYQGFDDAAYFRNLLDSLRWIPGVTAATIAHNRPIGLVWKQTIQPGNVGVTYHRVGPGFFDALGMRILSGRDFDVRDDPSRPPIAIVSARLAQLLFGSGAVMGRRIIVGDQHKELEIVGVASDATLDDPCNPNAPAAYVPLLQYPDFLGWSEAIVRTPGDPKAVSRALQEHIEALRREYPLRIESVDAELDQTLLPERVLTLLTGFFGALGVLLAAVGLYGLLAYAVARRTAEIGVRVALGATQAGIAGLVLREVGIMLVGGLAAGLAVVFVGGRVIRALLYGVSSSDPWSLALAAMMLSIMAALAGMIPAIQAARVDPAAALRKE